jgi:polyisoprenoid-binding protein YceI
MSPSSLHLPALSALLLAAAALPAAAQGKPGTAQLLPAQSEMAFTTRQMGVPVEGRFGKFAATIALDPKAPESGSVTFTIDTASARFGAAEVDAEVVKPGWLDALKFPQASFRSTSIKAAGPNRFEVAGQLTLKGVARDLVVPVQLAPAGAGLSAASGSFTLKRLDFRIGDGDWNDPSLVANEVLVRFRLVLSGFALP